MYAIEVTYDRDPYGNLGEKLESFNDETSKRVVAYELVEAVV